MYGSNSFSDGYFPFTCFRCMHSDYQSQCHSMRYMYTQPSLHKTVNLKDIDNQAVYLVCSYINGTKLGHAWRKLNNSWTSEPLLQRPQQAGRFESYEWLVEEGRVELSHIQGYRCTLGWLCENGSNPATVLTINIILPGRGDPGQFIFRPPNSRTINFEAFKVRQLFV